MATTASQIRDLLRPGINKIIGEYAQLPTQWSEIFENHKSDMSFEVDVEVKLLGQAQIRAEGAATAFEDMGERSSFVYRHVTMSLGFVMTKNAIRDNLYKTQFGPNTRALKNSMRQAWETVAANVLNNGATNSAQFFGGDGVSLFSTSHPIDVGTVANTPSVPAQLNETSLQDAIIGIRRFRDVAGLTGGFKARKLVIAPESQFVANRLLHSVQRPGTADNDTNATRELGLINSTPIVNDYLTDTASWFVLTDCPDGLKSFSRDPFELDYHTDFTSDNLMAKATERKSFGWSNWRGVWGSLP